MPTTEIHDLAAPYVLGALNPDETSAYERHLDACPSCQEEVARLGQGLMAMVADDASSPPSRLRARILADVHDQPSPDASRPWWRGVRTYVLVAVAAAIGLVVALTPVITRDPVEEILAAPDAVSTKLTVDESYPGTPPTVARVVFSASRAAAVVEFIGLESPSPDTTYQLWLIDAEGPVSAGTFLPTDTGMTAVRLQGEARSGVVVGITVEPSGGSTSPTGAVLFSAEI